MKLFSIALVTFLFLSGCSKTNHVAGSAATDVTMIDSVAKLYGFTRSSETYTSMPRQSLTVNEFVTLMKNRNQPVMESLGGNNSVTPLTVTDTSSVAASGWPNYSQMDGLGGGVYTSGSLSYSFSYLQTRAYPSIYQITLQLNTTSGGEIDVIGIGGSSFVYSGIGSPLPPVQWAYSNRGGSAHGIANFTTGFSATCYGTETEVITIAGYTYTMVYTVTFRIQNQVFNANQTYATVNLQRVN